MLRANLTYTEGMKRLRDFTVGDTFEAVREVDPYRPVYYAAASGDFNPIHIDANVGRAAGYSGVILQGMCTFSWLSDACVAYLGDASGRASRSRCRSETSSRSAGGAPRSMARG